jgi:hypothetical protein
VSQRTDGAASALKKFALIEIALLISVIFLFQILPSHYAGVVAGLGFLTLGLALLRFTFKGPKPWRSTLTYAVLLYLVCSVLPILIGRLLNWGTEFKDVEILGLSGPKFHRISEILYLALIFSTVFELLKIKRAGRSTAR